MKMRIYKMHTQLRGVYHIQICLHCNLLFMSVIYMWGCLSPVLGVADPADIFLVCSCFLPAYLRLRFLP